MKFTIMQMPMSLWHKEHILFNEDTRVNQNDYVPVYKGDVPPEVDQSNVYAVLEYLFEIFNIHHPENYPGRSLSRGDVVLIEKDNTLTYYLCASFGWHAINYFR
jgi:hypothetical protein